MALDTLTFNDILFYGYGQCVLQEQNIFQTLAHTQANVRNHIHTHETLYTTKFIFFFVVAVFFSYFFFFFLFFSALWLFSILDRLILQMSTNVCAIETTRTLRIYVLTD